ncbi:UNVERIFIED_CONTAM: hypothetical protein HDU68_012538 [Siphonaria sp. JEL0065]|nr:hypothetical protein HDU68_012538 [Siphonaria sp. JEL0065]
MSLYYSDSSEPLRAGSAIFINAAFVMLLFMKLALHSHEVKEKEADGLRLKRDSGATESADLETGKN